MVAPAEGALPLDKNGQKNAPLRLAVAADHAGYELKQLIYKDLRDSGFPALDLGAHVPGLPDDYPDFAELVAKTMTSNRVDRAIVICGSGVGVCVALNKFPGIRAGICHDTYSARQGVEHDDMNVLCLGSRIVGVELAKLIVRAFLSSCFTGEERHVRRLAKILAIERRFVKSW